MKRNDGFTLIEMIVVITIMVVVTAIGTVSYTSANKSARDSKRKADLGKLQIGLELFKQETGAYPPNGTVILSSGSTLVPSFMQAIPTDPKGFSYVYDRPTNYTYTLDAYLENGGNGSYGSCGASICNYRVANP